MQQPAAQQQQTPEQPNDQKILDENQRQLYLQQMQSNMLAQQKLDQYLSESNEKLTEMAQNNPEQLQGLLQQRQMFSEMNKKFAELLDKTNQQDNKNEEQSP